VGSCRGRLFEIDRDTDPQDDRGIEERRLLRGLLTREEHGKAALAAQIRDPIRETRRPLARTSAWRRLGGSVSGREAEEDLGGSSALERLMGAKEGVIEERELDSTPGFRLGERRKRAEAEKAFRSFPEPFDDGILPRAPKRWEIEESRMVWRKASEVN
jgi:hypothetical protein